MGEMDMAAFPDEVLEYVLKFLTSRKDRNAVSLVCKAWCRTESFSRQAVYIGNCYAVSPEILIRRFPRVKCVTLKGKPRFADFGLVPYQWGAFLYPWVAAMALEYPWLEELRLKRMTVTDESLAMLAHSFPNFRLLVLINCDGFSTDGLAAVASRCRHLRELNLQECEVENHGGHWLSCFPETFTSLVSLNFACLEGAVNYDALERLVARSPSLQSLRLNKEVTLQQLQRLLVRAPQLIDLGTGSYCQQLKWGQYAELQAALTNCKSLASLSGFWDVAPVLIRSLYSICPNLTSLNLSYVTLSSSYFCKLISCCSKLQKLWVQDSVEDKGLQQVGMVCRDLRELRVFPQHPARQGNVTEAGLEFISRGCPNLSSVLYFCRQCTNESVAVVARNCPGLIRFRLCIITPFQTDHITGEPMDEAFGAIVKHCKNLRRLAVSGLLTDKAFEYIGMYGKKLETLSVAFAGESDVGMQHVLNGCTNLRKLEIRDSPFGDTALLSGMERYESMRFLWMSSCKVTLLGCGSLAVQKTRLNVEIIKPEDGENMNYEVGKLYVYRSLAGPRLDSDHIVTL